MSGGSFDHLYTKEPEDLVRGPDDALQDMQDELAHRGLDDIVADHQRFLSSVRHWRGLHKSNCQQLDAVAKTFRELWRMIELNASCDANDAQVGAAVIAYRASRWARCPRAMWNGQRERWVAEFERRGLSLWSHGLDGYALCEMGDAGPEPVTTFYADARELILQQAADLFLNQEGEEATP